nr:hypothetical protein [Salinicola acroporae]
MQDVSILNRDWLLIGRQVRTAFDKLIDLLAIDANGTVIIIELKRDKTPREVVAQTIDYASWIAGLGTARSSISISTSPDATHARTRRWTRRSRPSSASRCRTPRSTNSIRW